MERLRSPRSVLLLAVAALAGVGVVAACSSGGGGESGPTDSFDRRAMLANIGENVILATYTEFRDAAQELKDATAAARVAVGTSAGVATLDSARNAWIVATDLWQQAELYQVGPAGSEEATLQGEFLRDRIYAWPAISTCGIDQEIVNQNHDDPGYFDTAFVDVYGLYALEYLLFSEDPEDTCPSGTGIDAAWDALTATELAQRRADYADAVAGNLVSGAQALIDAWSPSGGAFLRTFSEAGTPGNPYGQAHDAVNDLFGALYYLDLMTKDDKLGIPAGIHVECPTATCLDRIESPWAGRSKENIAANLRGWRRVLLGGDTAAAGIGFDDFLTELGAADVAADVETRTDAAIVAVEAIPGTLEEAIASSDPSVAAAHTAVKGVTDILKSQFISVLDLRIPEGPGVDND